MQRTIDAAILHADSNFAIGSMRAVSQGYEVVPRSHHVQLCQVLILSTLRHQCHLPVISCITTAGVRMLRLQACRPLEVEGLTPLVLGLTCCFMTFGGQQPAEPVSV